MQVGPPLSKKTKVGKGTAAIIFTNEDLTRMHTPHNDALVVTLRMVVERILPHNAGRLIELIDQNLKRLETEDAMRIKELFDDLSHFQDQKGTRR